jgi:NADPH-dependent curcumin reductase CurA
MRRTKAIVLARKVGGMPAPGDFGLAEETLPDPGPGQALVRVEWLSIDPYLRPLLAGRHLTKPPAIGETIPGIGLGTVVASGDPRFPVGATLVGETGWREWALVETGSARPVDRALAPPEAHLGVLGIPGLTAWAGLRTIGRPVAGETVLVSSAAGAVGSLATQLAREAGCRVVGINGSDEKNRLSVERFGCDAAVNYRSPEFVAELRAACPDGVDVYFDNVGGAILEAAIGMLRKHARVVLCGLIDQYNRDTRPVGPNLGPVIGARARLEGLVVYDHLGRFPEFVAEVGPKVADGRIRWLADVRDGLAAAPEQFIALLEGRNVGKALVRVAAEGAA